jgi:hypothetical protein
MVVKVYLRVLIDVSLYSCSKLEHLHEINELSLLCRSPDWQWMGFNDSIQSHCCISGKTCAIPNKATAICELLNVWSVKSGQLENTSSITSKQSCSGKPESTSYCWFRVGRFSFNNL